MSALFSDNKIPQAIVQKQSEGWKDFKENSRHSVTYYRSGEIEKKHFAYCNERFKVSCEYFKSGGLMFESYNDEATGFTLEKRWNVAGQLISDKKWVNGKYLGDAIQKQ
jgi:hypothetical protein